MERGGRIVDSKLIILIILIACILPDAIRSVISPIRELWKKRKERKEKGIEE